MGPTGSGNSQCVETHSLSTKKSICWIFNCFKTLEVIYKRKKLSLSHLNDLLGLLDTLAPTTPDLICLFTAESTLFCCLYIDPTLEIFLLPKRIQSEVPILVLMITQ